MIAALLFVIAALVASGSINPFSGKGQTNNNQTLTDKALDTAIPADVVGIPECDQVIALLTAETNEKTSYGHCIDARNSLI